MNKKTIVVAALIVAISISCNTVRETPGIIRSNKTIIIGPPAKALVINAVVSDSLAPGIYRRGNSIYVAGWYNVFNGTHFVRVFGTFAKSRGPFENLLDSRNDTISFHPTPLSGHK